MAPELTQSQKYHFKRELEQLEKAKGQHTELVSLYIPPTKAVHDVTNYLRSEYAQSSNIKSTGTRKNVQAAIQSALGRLKNLRTFPANGLAIFVGEVLTGNNQTRMEAHIIEPPQAVSTFLYRCDNKFHLDHLKGMLTEKDVYGLLLVDRREATIGLLRGKVVQQLWYDTSLVPGKHGRGGQSQRRFERLIEIAADEWFKTVAEHATQIFLPMEGLRGILVGGPGPTKKYFVDATFLHHELQKKVVDQLFDTGYTDEYGLKELVQYAGATLTELEVAQERKVVQRLLEEVRKTTGGLAVYGEAYVRKALELGAVETLLLSETLRRESIDLECQSEVCGNTLKATLKAEEVDAYRPPKCPKCGSEMLIARQTDVVEELSVLAESSGSTVVIVGAESEEGETLAKAFGGMAGILRYNVNFEKVMPAAGSGASP